MPIGETYQRAYDYGTLVWTEALAGDRPQLVVVHRLPVEDVASAFAMAVSMGLASEFAMYVWLREAGIVRIRDRDHQGTLV